MWFPAQSYETTCNVAISGKIKWGVVFIRFRWLITRFRLPRNKSWFLTLIISRSNRQLTSQLHEIPAFRPRSLDSFRNTVPQQWIERSQMKVALGVWIKVITMYLTSIWPIIMRLTSSSRILGVFSCTAADDGVPNTWDLDACHATPTDELIRPSLSMGCVTLIFIVPSSSWPIAGIEEAALARELCVRSR